MSRQPVKAAPAPAPNKAIRPVFRRATGELYSPAPAPASRATPMRAAPLKAPILAPAPAAVVTPPAPVQNTAQTQIPLAPILPVAPAPARRAMPAPSTNSATPDHIDGELTFVQMYRDWGRGEVLTDRGQKFTVVGSALSSAEKGGRYRFSGRFIEHAKYGRQLDVISLTTDVQSHDALIAHIRKNFNGVGPATAQKLILLHEEQGTMDTLRHNLVYQPSVVDFSPVTSREVTLIDDDDSNKSRVINALSLQYGDLGIPAKVIKGLASVLLNHTQEKATKDPRLDRIRLAYQALESNPYRWIDSIQGYTFLIADRIGRRTGFDRHNPTRVAALVAYTLEKSCEAGGHSYLMESDLCEGIMRFDGLLNPIDAISIARENGVGFVVDEDFGLPRYYPRSVYLDESQVVDTIVHRMSHSFEPLASINGVMPSQEVLDQVMARAQEIVRQKKGLDRYVLDPSQREALQGILTSDSGIHTLTAGPGCGKTDIMEMLLTCIDLLQVSHKYAFCAPVGKAAKVLSSRIGDWGEASTIHRLLQYQGAEFFINAENPLDTSMALLDEGSMLGTPLGAALLSSLPDYAHFISLGDVEQLSPIESGEVLRSLLAFDELDHHRLTKTHRNQGSIKEVVDAVKSGKWKSINDDKVTCSGSLPPPSPNHLKQLAYDVKTAAQQHGGLEHVGVITPYRRGDVNEPGWNVTYLNNYLREYLNPESDSSYRVTGSSLRINDRIIITEGQRTQCGEQVVNGDTGFLIDAHYKVDEDSYQRQLSYVVLRLDDGQMVELDAEALNSVSLAYAITTHAAQGSEYKSVFAFCPDGHESFIHRYMLITMLSRARERLVVYGDDATLAKVAKREPPKRNCGIVERVTAQMHELDQELSRQSSRELARA